MRRRFHYKLFSLLFFCFLFNFFSVSFSCVLSSLLSDVVPLSRLQGGDGGDASQKILRELRSGKLEMPVQDLTSDGNDVNKNCELLDSLLGRIASDPEDGLPTCDFAARLQRSANWNLLDRNPGVP